MSSSIDLRQELWQCLRLWLFDYYFAGSSGYPIPEASKYSFTAAVTHGLSHWKSWMARKPALISATLQARYKTTIRGDGPTTCLRIPPDAGEYLKRDYVLFANDATGQRVICAAESEGGKEIRHICEDFPKLLSIESPLKAMIYRAPYVHLEDPQQSFAVRKSTIESMLTQQLSTPGLQRQPREDWLFVGIPWYKQWPVAREQTHVCIHTLSTPCELPTVLQEPEWDIWHPASEMDNWIRSLNC